MFYSDFCLKGHAVTTEFYQYQELDKKWLQTVVLLTIKITLRDQAIQIWATKLTLYDSTKFYTTRNMVINLA